MEIILYAISGLLGGGVLSYFMWDKALKSKRNQAQTMEMKQAFTELEQRLQQRQYQKQAQAAISIQ